jgi:FlaA1/EpsC-like NDP-sugar epimerase
VVFPLGFAPSAMSELGSAWREQVGAGQPLTVTDPRMTRFVMTIEQAVDLIRMALVQMQGGEIFIPALPATDVITLAKAVGGFSMKSVAC